MVIIHHLAQARVVGFSRHGAGSASKRRPVRVRIWAPATVV
jgi:hypothetical protein